MKLEQFYIFQQIAASKSIRKASENLYFTPQHLSKEMIALEKELHVTLYERTSTGIRLTKEGEEAYHHICTILEAVEDFKHKFSVEDDIRNTDAYPVNIHTVPVMDSYVSFITRDLYELFPEAAINDNVTPRSRLKRHVLNGEIIEDADIIITNIPQDDIQNIHRRIRSMYHCYFLFSDVLHLQVPKNSIYAKMEEIPYSVLSDLPLMLYTADSSSKTEFEELMQKEQIQLRNVSYNSNLDTCSKIALNSGKYCLVGYPSVESRPLPNCEYVPIEGNYTLDNLLFVLKKPKNPRAVRTFQEAFDDLFNLKKIF